LICLAPSAESAVIAIDYGAQWFKVSLVKPGVPLEIVLNRESKRKTRSIVALRDGKRTFDTEAVNLVGFLLDAGVMSSRILTRRAVFERVPQTSRGNRAVDSHG
jgi:molecular chaperone DnaK (HSP70)